MLCAAFDAMIARHDFLRANVTKHAGADDRNDQQQNQRRNQDGPVL